MENSAKDLIKMLRKLDDKAEPYKVPAHLRGEIDLKELKRDLDMLNEPLIDGMFNLCYGDGYFSNSLKEKYGKSIVELMDIVSEMSNIKICPNCGHKNSDLCDFCLQLDIIVL